MTKKKQIDKHYEIISKLYVRLKGYIVSNLIIHSEKHGDSSSELDILGIRFPFHSQEDRMVNIQDYLESSDDRIEVIIADVKNVQKIENVKYNKGLRRDKESIKKFINWLGCFENVEDPIIDKFTELLNLHRKRDLNGFAEFQMDTKFGKLNFKFTFFCPSLEPWGNSGFKYIDSTEMLGFIWECLNQTIIVDTCSRKYNYSNWNEYEEYVIFFKEQNGSVTKEQFENHFRNK